MGKLLFINCHNQFNLLPTVIIDLDNMFMPKQEKYVVFDNTTNINRDYSYHHMIKELLKKDSIIS